MLFRKKFWGDKPKDKSVIGAGGVVISDLDERGAEVLDPTPMSPPIGFRQTPSMMELVRQMVQSERLKAAAQAEGFETFEESEDFDVDDDFDPSTPFENDFDPPIAELKAALEDEKKARAAAPVPKATPGAEGSPPEPLKTAPQPPEAENQ